MKRKPKEITEKQYNLLISLGIEDSKIPMTCQEASKLISILLSEKEKTYKSIHDMAENLKENLPKSEVWFLEELKRRDLSFNFKSNVVINNKYIADFLDEQNKVVFEIDGEIHNKHDVAVKDYYKDLVDKIYAE